MIRTRYSYPDLAALRQQMNQLYRNESARNKRGDRDTPWNPPIELENFSDRLVLRVLLPGVNPQDVDIGVTRETVTLQGNRPYHQKSNSRGFFQAEFQYGEFHRTIDLPFPISREGIRANFTNGILTLTSYKWKARENCPVKIDLANAEPSDRDTPQPIEIADPWEE
ncbi:MAG: Hsp20/alpha crystallin family protein [Cyanobacteria bacterium SBLK]|nr:Hsp20/alpha crystallin family protein [Cyanobacteria bacterium SBLK]